MMRIVIFTHPEFLQSQSMPRFAKMIAQGMEARGHSVERWMPTPFFYRLALGKRVKKWLGYLDQFLLFPLQIKHRLRNLPQTTLFVFSDQALGPYVSLVAKRPHVVHVHDFMALRSALGEFKQNPVGWSGRQYQAMIRRGFERGRCFVSVSENTRKDLHRFLPEVPRYSEVVYNGLNYPFRPLSKDIAHVELAKAGISVPSGGFILHVGGNQWYKNRTGVLEIYEAYVKQEQNPLPLWLVGAPPNHRLKSIAARIHVPGEIKFVTGLSDEQVCAAYSIARLLIFPSIAEGFGWPIAEGMACGCPVLTTSEAPMTEVGGDAVFYIPRQPEVEDERWAIQAAIMVSTIMALPLAERERRRELGYNKAATFNTQLTMAAYERIYGQVLALEELT